MSSALQRRLDRLGDVPLCVARRKQEQRGHNDLRSAARRKPLPPLGDSRSGQFEEARLDRSAANGLLQSLGGYQELLLPQRVSGAMTDEQDAYPRRERGRV